MRAAPALRPHQALLAGAAALAILLVGPPPARAEPHLRAQHLMLAVGSELVYTLHDRLTGISQRVSYHVDRLEDGRVVFNQGGRVEDTYGQVLEMPRPLGGEADVAMPPGGWVPAGAVVGTEWKTAHQGYGAGAPRLELRARATSQEALSLAGRQLQTLRVEYDGFVARQTSMVGAASGSWRATAWYSPELQRVVRFQVFTRGGSMGSSFVIDEVLELAAVR